MTIPVADQRHLQSVAATLQVTWVDQDGAQTAPTAPVTVAVTRADGTVLLAAGTAATVAGNTATKALTASQTATLDLLTAVWTDAAGRVRTTTHEIVGGYYATVDEIKAMPDCSSFTTSQVVNARRWFEDTFEQYVGSAFVPRYRLITVWGGGTDYIDLPDRNVRTPLRSLAFGTIAFTGTALTNTVATATGRIQRYFPYVSNATDDQWGRWADRFPVGVRVTVGYEHGLTRPPEDVHDACLVAVADKLLTDKTGPRREYATVTELGIVRNSVPGADRPFGIPYIDRVANDMRAKFGRGTVASVPVG